MEDGLLNLKWNSQKNTFFEILKVQREKSNYTDATLAVEGTFYPVHKLVMSICSEYFSDIFEKTACKSPVIVLKDVRSQDVEALLDYMYLGEVNVNQKDLESVLKTAKSLRIKGLAIPDQDPTKLRKKSNKSHDDTRQDSPPPKRRRHVSDTIQRPVASPVPSPQISASTFVSPSVVSNSTSNSSNIEKNELPFVKVEIIDEEPEEITYEGDVKKEHELEDTGNSSLPGPSSLQQSFPLNTKQDEPPDMKDVEVVEVENYNAEELEERFGRENDYEYDVSSDYDIFAGPSSLQQTNQRKRPQQQTAGAQGSQARMLVAQDRRNREKHSNAHDRRREGFIETQHEAQDIVDSYLEKVERTGSQFSKPKHKLRKKTRKKWSLVWNYFSDPEPYEDNAKDLDHGVRSSPFIAHLRLRGQHFIRSIGTNYKGTSIRLRCHVCLNPANPSANPPKRKNTSHCCKDCKKPLCSYPCFEIYHTELRACNCCPSYE